MNIYTEKENNDQCNDSNFQEEGNYYIKEMPKYKYEIRIFHKSPNREQKSKTPDKMISAAKFTILNKSKKNNVKLGKKIKIKNTENNNELNKSKSPRNGTIRFFSGKDNIQKCHKKFALLAKEDSSKISLKVFLYFFPADSDGPHDYGSSSDVLKTVAASLWSN